MIKRTTFAAAISCGLAGTATAQGLFDFDPAEPEFYVGLFAGGAFPGDADLDGRFVSNDPAQAGSVSNAFEFENSTSYGGFAGYRLPFRYWAYFQPRLEFEISRFEGDLESARVNGVPHTVAGSQSVTFFLINNYSDIIWTENQTIVPYVGGGIGLAQIDISTRTSPSDAPSAIFSIDDETSAFTSTFGAGLSYRASEQFELYTEARYYTVYGADVGQAFTASGVSAATGDVGDDFDGAQVTAGLRIRF